MFLSDAALPEILERVQVVCAFVETLLSPSHVGSEPLGWPEL